MHDAAIGFQRVEDLRCWRLAGCMSGSDVPGIEVQVVAQHCWQNIQFEFDLVRPRFDVLGDSEPRDVVM